MKGFKKLLVSLAFVLFLSGVNVDYHAYAGGNPNDTVDPGGPNSIEIE